MSANQRISLKPANGMAYESSNGQSMVLVYRPKKYDNGNFVLDSDGGAIFERIGGAPVGCNGIIAGPSVRGNRTLFLEYKNVSATMGKDLVNVFPIQLDTYPDIAWILADCIKPV